MATLDDVRAIASTLPGAVEGEDRFGFSVDVKGKAKGFLWTWMERVEPKKPKVANEGVIAVVVPNLMIKEVITQSNLSAFVEDDHYRNYPAVLVRLEAISVEELEPLILEAYAVKAAKSTKRS